MVKLSTCGSFFEEVFFFLIKKFKNFNDLIFFCNSVIITIVIKLYLDFIFAMDVLMQVFRKQKKKY